MPVLLGRSTKLGDQIINFFLAQFGFRKIRRSEATGVIPEAMADQAAELFNVQVGHSGDGLVLKPLAAVAPAHVQGSGEDPSADAQLVGALGLGTVIRAA